MTYPGLSMCNESSKIHYFMDFWHFFCWRLWRPWMLLSTKSMGHKSKFRISWMYRFCFYGLKVHFWWPNKCLFWCNSSLNTLYNTRMPFHAVFVFGVVFVLFLNQPDHTVNHEVCSFITKHLKHRLGNCSKSYCKLAQYQKYIIVNNTTKSKLRPVSAKYNSVMKYIFIRHLLGFFDCLVLIGKSVLW